jgi:hypothetical protein
MGARVKHLTIVVHVDMSLRRSRHIVSLSVTMVPYRAIRHGRSRVSMGSLGVHNKVLKRGHVGVHLGSSKNAKDGRLSRTLTMSSPGRINYMEIRVGRLGHCGSSDFHLLPHSITKRYILFPGN